MLRRVLLALCLVLALTISNISRMGGQLVPSSSPQPDLLIINNDGSIYKFDPGSRTILWHSSLNTSLISFNQIDSNPEDKVDYFLPNFDGNFIYISQSNKPLSIERRELEHLLNRCFDKNNQYFLYDSVDFYVMGLQTGQIFQLKAHLDDQKQIDKGNLIVRVDRKYLKSLGNNTQAKWSVISSFVSILTVKDFIRNSKAQNQITKNSHYRFERTSGNSMNIKDIATGQKYELESDSSFISIFSIENNRVSKHAIETSVDQRQERLKLDTDTLQNEFGSLETQLIGYQNIIDEQSDTDYQISQMEFCLNSQKVLDNQSLRQRKPPGIIYDFPSVVVDKSVSFFSQLVIGGLVLSLVGVCLGYLINKVKKDIQCQLQNNKSGMEKRLEVMQRQILQTKVVPKSLPYAIKYQSLKRTHSDIKVYVSTILSKQTQVTIYPLHRHSSVVKRVQTGVVLNNRKLIKVWHHEVSQEEYLIFTDKIAHTLEDYLKLNNSANPKSIMIEIVEMVKTLFSNKFEVNCMSPSHIFIDDDGELKYNLLVPVDPKWSNIDSVAGRDPTQKSVLFMLGNILYYVFSKGQTLMHFESDTPESIQSGLKQQRFTKEAEATLNGKHALKDLITNLVEPQNGESKIDISNIASHPFFWDEHQNLCFVNEFSNYVQTHLDDERVKKFETASKNSQVIILPWSHELPRDVINDVVNFRKYNFASIRDLIRVIRNKSNHFHQLPESVRKITGRTKEQMCTYFLNKFPKLLYFMYRYALKKKWKLHGFF